MKAKKYLYDQKVLFSIIDSIAKWGFPPVWF